MFDHNVPLNDYDLLDLVKELNIKDFFIFYPKENLNTECGIINLSRQGPHYVTFY